MELRKYWEIICRRKWIVISTFLIIVTISFAGANIATKIYEAKSKILIESTDIQLSLISAIGMPVQGLSAPPKGSNETYDTEIELSQIRPILEKLITKLNLKNRHGEKLETDKITFSLADLIFLEPYIAVEQYKNSDLLRITGGSTNREEAAKIANELANLYIADIIERTKQNYKVARIFLENKINTVKEEYYNALLERKEFMTKEATVNLQEEIRDLLNYISTLNIDFKDNEIAVAQANESIMLIEKKLAGKVYTSSNLINNMETALNNLLIDLSAKKIEFTEEHPDVLQLNNQINTIKKLLKDKMEFAFSDKEISIAPVYDDLLMDLKDAYINKAVTEIKRDVLKELIDKSQAELIKIPSKSMKQSQIDLSLSVNQEIYKNLLEYMNQIGIAESMTISNIKLVEPAVEPDINETYFPKKTLIYVLGVFLGTFWGFFLAFLVDYVDHTIQIPEDLKDYRFTFLGSIPKFKKDKYLVSMTDTNDPLYEAYRRVLSSMHFAEIDKPNKKLLIGSLSPMTGSSTTAANLGIVLAREGRKVLLVDADLRRPNLHNLFGLPNTAGLTDLLLGNTQAGDVIHSLAAERLDILTTGAVPPDSGLLMKSHKMQEIIEQLDKKYDILLFHCAPILIKNDALLLMKNLDAIAILLKSKKTTHYEIIKADELLKNANITPIGVILNCV